MAEKKELPMADKKQNVCECGCGCAADNAKDVKALKPSTDNPEK